MQVTQWTRHAVIVGGALLLFLVLILLRHSGGGENDEFTRQPSEPPKQPNREAEPSHSTADSSVEAPGVSEPEYTLREWPRVLRRIEQIVYDTGLTSFSVGNYFERANETREIWAFLKKYKPHLQTEISSALKRYRHPSHPVSALLVKFLEKTPAEKAERFSSPKDPELREKLLKWIELMEKEKSLPGDAHTQLTRAGQDLDSMMFSWDALRKAAAEQGENSIAFQLYLSAMENLGSLPLPLRTYVLGEGLIMEGFENLSLDVRMRVAESVLQKHAQLKTHGEKASYRMFEWLVPSHLDRDPALLARLGPVVEKHYFNDAVAALPNPEMASVDVWLLREHLQYRREWLFPVSPEAIYPHLPEQMNAERVHLAMAYVLPVWFAKVSAAKRETYRSRVKPLIEAILLRAESADARREGEQYLERFEKGIKLSED